MSTEALNAASPLGRLTAVAARHRIDERELERVIFDAANFGGLSQREISDKVMVYSQATVQRILRRLTDNPALRDESPAEVIDRRAAGLITSEEMMDRLLKWQYSFGGVVRIDGVATDAYSTGDWDNIEMAFYRGLLSDGEFEALAARHLQSMGSAQQSR